MKEKAKGAAALRNWLFEDYSGNLSLIAKLLDGEWNNDDCLIPNPGEKVSCAYND
jgi:hypothetical protein